MKNPALCLEEPRWNQRPLPRQAARPKTTGALGVAVDSLNFLFLLGSALGAFWAFSLF